MGQGQFAVEMPDGLVIERLPIGFSHGHRRLGLVCWGLDFLVGDPPRGAYFLDELRERRAITGVDAPVDHAGYSGGGGHDEQEYRVRIADNGITALRLDYLHDGQVVASETVPLDHRP